MTLTVTLKVYVLVNGKVTIRWIQLVLG